MDFKRSDDDRKFFADRSKAMDAVLADLLKAEKSLLDFDRGSGLKAQVRVIIGDEVLDRTVRDGNRMTKAELAGKPGLGAEHAFGNRVDDLTRTELELEPEAVMRAAARLANVPPFGSRDGIVSDLKGAATRQEKALADRTGVGAEEDKLHSLVRAGVMKGSEALAALEAALLGRFTRQYRYVGRFFAEFTPSRPRQGGGAVAAEQPPRAGT